VFCIFLVYYITILSISIFLISVSVLALLVYVLD